MMRINSEMFIFIHINSSPHSNVCVCVHKRNWLTVSKWLRGSEQLVCLSCGRTCWISMLVSEVWRAPYKTPPFGQIEAVRFWCSNYRSACRHAMATLKPQKCNLCFHSSARLIGGFHAKLLPFKHQLVTHTHYGGCASFFKSTVHSGMI